tara:strand:- start:5241 stop:6605 length:1365 start_codon:yes stop_codon:yes gene_type:complete
MQFETRNPATGELLAQFDYLRDSQLAKQLINTDLVAAKWNKTSFTERTTLIKAVATQLTLQRQSLAETISLETGKRLSEAFGEVDKCALVCDYYANNAQQMLADELITTSAQRSLVTYHPLGIVLAIMPWNYPFWQVFRCLAPALMAGNALLLKHAPNVPQCGRAIEKILLDAGASQGLMTNLFISVEQTSKLIADDRVKAISFTGSESAGRKIASLAGAHLKKVVLELGGSDPFIVLDDADMDKTIDAAMLSRFGNAGQTCIAAKRFLVVPSRLEEFTALLLERVTALVPGNPLLSNTTIAPMARPDIRDKVHQQVEASIAAGACPLIGCEILTGDGYYYAPSILTNVSAGMPAFDEELFGPVAAIIAVKDETDAILQANATRFGLGASIWTQDIKKGEAILAQIDAGTGFVNAMVSSDIHMPFGGIKASGLGRELGESGIKELCYSKSIWIN